MTWRRALVGLVLVLAVVVGLVVVFLRARLAEIPGGEAPARGAVEAVVRPLEESRLTLVARMELDALRASIERDLPEILVEKAGEPAKGDWRYDLTVRRVQPLRLRGDQAGHLVLDVPLEVWAKTYRGRTADRRARKGREAPDGVQLDAGIALAITVDYRIAEDWSLDPVVEVAHTWTSDPALSLGPLSFRVRKPVDKLLEPRLAEAAAGIRQRVVERDDLRARLETTWRELGNPRPGRNGGWIVIEPLQLAVSAPTVRGDVLEVPVGLRARIRNVVGERPPPLDPGPLPPRADVPDAPEGVRIAAEVRLPWEELERRVRADLADQRWTTDLGELTVHDVQIYPSGERVAVGLLLEGENAVLGGSGWVWLLGRPVLDAPSERIVVEGFDFVVQAEGSWIETANHASLRDQVRASVEPRLVFPFGEQVQAELRRMNARPRDELALHLDRLDVRSLALTDEAVVVNVDLAGSASLAL
ncbi:MAG: DUF4403 family protein [Myxococcales bacterium]|nr:DUF4403 family protein [Myxococcales bacterium]